MVTVRYQAQSLANYLRGKGGIPREGVIPEYFYGNFTFYQGMQ